MDTSKMRAVKISGQNVKFMTRNGLDYWVGPDFSEPDNGVLVLGESTYGDDLPLCDYIPNWCESALREPDRTFSRIFNAFSGACASSASNTVREAFWATIAFTNFVQQSVGPTNQYKATVKDFQNAAKTLSGCLYDISPRGVLILGKGQAEFSAPIIQNLGIPCVICPHPTGYGVKTTTLQSAWNKLKGQL